MLATIISKIGIPFLVAVIGGALGSVNNPVAQSASKALQNFEGAMADGAVTSAQIAEANRHAERMAELKAREYETALSEVNQTMRGEAASTDAYVRRMRPTFGYLMAVTWAAQMLALAYIVVFETDQASAVLSSMEALSAMWAMGLSVLGIYVYKRSEEKKLALPSIPPEDKVRTISISKTTNAAPAKPTKSGIHINE